MKQFIFLVFIAAAIASCTNESSNPKVATIDDSFLIDPNPSMCPYLTKDAAGNIVLSWVRLVNDSTTLFCFATSQDGKNFGEPVSVPNSNGIQPHSENLPKIIFKPSGEIIALWGSKSTNNKNKYARQVSYTQSFDGGKTWTQVRPLVTDTAGNDQRYYDVAILPNGEAGIIWLDNRKTTQQEGSGLYFAATSGRNGFNGGKLISEPCCQCCRTDLFVDRKGGIHALFRGIVQDSIRDMVHIISQNGGNSFSVPKRISEDNWVISGCPHTGPAMTENNAGLHFAWFTGGKAKGCYYTTSTDGGGSFSKRDSISSLGSHPQITTLSDGSTFTAWDENHLVNGAAVKRIGWQQRTADGKAQSKDYLETKFSSGFPVVLASGQRSAVIAYTTQNNDSSYVAVHTVTL